MATRIWSIASGKGGVGKTFVTSSLGIALSRMRQTTLLIDLDLSGPNLHTTLGGSTSDVSLDAFFEGKKNLNDLVRPTKFANLNFIQGASHLIKKDVPAITRLFNEARNLGYREVLIDFGPGSQESYLEGLKKSDERIFVVTPEPSSIEKNYRLIENMLIYGLKDKSPTPLTSVLDSFKLAHHPGSKTFKEHLKTEVGFEWDEETNPFRNPIHLIVNQTRFERDEDIGSAIKTVCGRYFDVSIAFAGAVSHDNAVWQSFRTTEATLVKYPFSSLAGQFQTLARKLLYSNLDAQDEGVVV